MEKSLIFGYLYGYNDELDLSMFSNIDMIIFSFALVKNNQAYLEKNKRRELQKIISLKPKNTKISLAIGGWGADGFSDAVLTKEAREVFVTSIIDLITEFDLDGIDLDWEYPTLSFANILSRPEDKENLTYFVKDLREKIKKVKSDFIFTMALGAFCFDCIEISKLVEYVDYFNVMTYDFDYYTPPLTYHLTNLDSDELDLEAFSIKKTVDGYHKRGIPLKKIIIGGTMYGRSKLAGKPYTNTGLKSNRIGDIGYYTYKEIKEKFLSNNDFSHFFDMKAKADYLFNFSTGEFITYECCRSIKYKCDYIKEKKLAGIMFWELSGDYEYELINSVVSYIKDKKGDNINE